MSPLTVVVASGKGGTGKTLIATSLARRLSAGRLRVTYLDADVDAPNGQLALNATIVETQKVTRSVARILPEACRRCGECVGVCAFGALYFAPTGPAVVDEHCRDCGACALICRRGAIHGRSCPVGEIALGNVGTLRFMAGTLRVGEQRGVPVVEALRRRIGEEDVAIIDAPPGTACSTVAALRGADLAILVTEPTPFGEHDLKLAAELCRSLEVPAVGVLNRAGLGAHDYSDVIVRARLEQWAEIPYDPAIAAAVSAGADPEAASPRFAQTIATLGERVSALRSPSSAVAVGAER
jgi:MinD superfamily P-loop ATPase